jgi:hypothetical protein
MRVVGWLGLAALTGFSMGFVSIGTAAAQGSGNDYNGGGSARLARSEGTVSSPWADVPALRMHFRVAWSRFLPLSWNRTGSLESGSGSMATDPAMVPIRRRGAR